MRVAIVGGGWAGMAAAVRAVQDGHAVTLFEAARRLGGRARGVPATLPDGREILLDNGQHILIGAYADTLRLMRQVGVAPDEALLRQPLSLRFPDGSGLALPDWPAPLDAFAGILRARGWGWRDKLALLRGATHWRRQGFRCDPTATVADLCAPLTQRLRDEFIEPLCVSALNTPARQASGQVFLRVLQDALFSQRGGSNLLLPRQDLGALFPDAAARWLTLRGGRVRTAQRIRALHWQAPHWRLDGEAFDRVILATSPAQALRLLADTLLQAPDAIARPLRQWMQPARALRFEAITTVYALAEPGAGPALLPEPMLALRPGRGHPAQFVFDRSQLSRQPDDQAGLLAFVVSASAHDRDTLQAQVMAQARAQLGLEVLVLQTIVEKHATFACTPALQRPPAGIAPGLRAAGDYVAGPYPATLEGAVRSGWAAAGRLAQAED